VELRDLPGALARITTVIAEANANIEEVIINAPSQFAGAIGEVDFVLKTRRGARGGNHPALGGGGLQCQGQPPAE